MFQNCADNVEKLYLCSLPRAAESDHSIKQCLRTDWDTAGRNLSRSQHPALQWNWKTQVWSLELHFKVEFCHKYKLGKTYVISGFVFIKA